MQAIYRNEEVLALIQGSYIIHDASVTKIDIYKEGNKLYIDVYFISISTKDVIQTQFKLSFMDVSEYSFYWNANFNFYTVESYKLLKLDKGFYLSLDPANSLNEISEDDKDIIWGKEIEGSFI